MDPTNTPLSNQISSTISARQMSLESTTSISITTESDPALSIVTQTTGVSDQDTRPTSASTSFTEEEKQIESSASHVVKTEISETISILPVSANSLASDSEMVSEPDVMSSSPHEPPVSESQDSASALFSSEIQPSETSESEMSTRSVSSGMSYEPPTFTDVLRSGSTSDLMNSESLTTAEGDSVFSRLSSSSTTKSSQFTTQTSEVTSTEVAESASIPSSDTFSSQSQTTTAVPLGAVSSTGAESMGSQSFLISPSESNTVTFSEEYSSSADDVSYFTSLETTTVEPTIVASSSVSTDSYFVSSTITTAFVSDTTVVPSVTASNNSVITTEDFTALQMSSIDPTSVIDTSLNTWVESSGDSTEMSSPSVTMVISSQVDGAVTSDMLYSADILSTPDTASSTETIIFPSSSDDLVNSVAISTTEGDVTSVRTTVDVTTQVTTTTETETTSTESVSTTTAPSDLEVLLIMDGDCDFVVATSENKQRFTKSIQVKIIYFLTQKSFKKMFTQRSELYYFHVFIVAAFYFFRWKLHKN